MDRNFFGSKSVEDTDQLRYLFNGAMIHGAQYRDAERRDIPVPYYLPQGPAGDTFGLLEDRPLPQPVGVIGLGTGGLATYARSGQSWTFFELDPDIVDIARSEFSYLRRSAGDLEIVVDDGREGLERRPSSHFGAIVIDAFSADAIPTHLITREAIRMYVDRLRSDGFLLFHVSNKYVDLRPLLGNTAEKLGLVA
ncbi:MAG: spermidine synthase, partial [Bradymonadaceae bacterium]